MGDPRLPGKIVGTVVRISDAGNLITDILADSVKHVPRDERTTVVCDEHQTSGLFGSDHKEPPMTLLAMIGDSGALELTIVGDSAQMMLGIRPGEKVVVSWQ